MLALTALGLFAIGCGCLLLAGVGLAVMWDLIVRGPAAADDAAAKGATLATWWRGDGGTDG